MTLRGRICSILFVSAFMIPPARALLNMNQAKDLIFVTGSYGVGYDSNVFTRSAGQHSFTQNASAAVDYSRQAGLIGVTVNASVSAGRFDAIAGQNYLDPSIAVGLRKRYGRTTGAVSFSSQRESQPDPDAGERTRSWNFVSALDLRYPVNDRYYLTNNFRAASRQYADSSVFSDLTTYTNAIAVNYIYTSKLDLNAGYTLTVSDTTGETSAYDQSFTVGATGSILPKLSGTVRMGAQQRNNQSATAGREHFNAFTSGTSLKWAYSRNFAVLADLNEDFSTTSTDISVNRASIGLHATATFASRLACTAGPTYISSDYLGEAGGGRRDDLIQFDANLTVSITKNIRASTAYVYMNNNSNSPRADFGRHNIILSVVATY